MKQIQALNTDYSVHLRKMRVNEFHFGITLQEGVRLFIVVKQNTDKIDNNFPSKIIDMYVSCHEIFYRFLQM